LTHHSISVTRNKTLHYDFIVHNKHLETAKALPSQQIYRTENSGELYILHFEVLIFSDVQRLIFVPVFILLESITFRSYLVFSVKLSSSSSTCAIK